MNQFLDFLNDCPAAIEQEFPGARNLILVNGEFRPNIDNFEYEYNWVSEQGTFKVVVNTFTKPGGEPGLKFVVFRVPTIERVSPIRTPIRVNLYEAYEAATERGFKPNLNNAIVFLQWEQGVTQAPAYWFLNANTNEWILVDAYDPEQISTTHVQPVQPA